MPTAIVQVPTRDGSGNWAFRVTEDGPIVTDFDKANFARQILEAVYLRGPGFKSYLAYLVQAGTGNPVEAVIYHNTIGAIVWARTAVGIYDGILTGTFSALKTACIPTIIGGQPSGVVYGSCFATDANTLHLVTNDAGEVSQDDWAMILEVRVYP